MYSALVIDDEPRACHILEILVSKYIPESTRFRRATTPAEGIALIQSMRPHLVFLDIEMPMQNGFDVLNAIDDIVRCETSSNYTFFHLTGNRRFCASKTLKEFEGMLKDHDFVRVHKSHLVNMQFVWLIDPAGVIHLTHNTQLTMSRRQRKRLN